MSNDLEETPPGYVYLGRGGTFKQLPGNRHFTGCTREGDVWNHYISIRGDQSHLHYCAPEGSEIVELNAKPEPTVEKHPGFIVWSPTRGEPTVKHNTRAEADAEAQRLAGKHPPTIFCVCEITARYQATVTVSKL